VIVFPHLARLDPFRPLAPRCVVGDAFVVSPPGPYAPSSHRCLPGGSIVPGNVDPQSKCNSCPQHTLPLSLGVSENPLPDLLLRLLFPFHSCNGFFASPNVPCHLYLTAWGAIAFGYGLPFLSLFRLVFDKAFLSFSRP